ncbi:MAG: hypothetical protein ACLR8Y_12315 [Alistipes indistinctus]
MPSRFTSRTFDNDEKSVSFTVVNDTGNNAMLAALTDNVRKDKNDFRAIQRRHGRPLRFQASKFSTGSHYRRQGFASEIPFYARRRRTRGLVLTPTIATIFLLHRTDLLFVPAVRSSLCTGRR